MRKNKNNSGFSLIELIVVVAMMAVLVGILAPKYITHVENARTQTCAWNMDGVLREVQLRASTDTEFMHELLDNVPEDGDIIDYIREETDIHVPECPSRGEYSMICDVDGGKITMTCTRAVHDLPVEGNLGDGEEE